MTSVSTNPFALNGLPRKLTAEAEALLFPIGDLKIQGLILAQLGALASPKLIPVEVTPTLDTSAYTAADVLFDTVELPNVLTVSGGTAKLKAVRLNDEDDNTAAQIDLVFFRSNVSLGTINGAPNISDANAREIIDIVPVPAANVFDLGGVKTFVVREINMPVYATTGTSIFVAGICRGTPTQTASGIKLRFFFERD